MYGLIGEIECVSGKRDQLTETLTTMGEMPGCLLYLVANDGEEPDVVWVVWDSREAHRASLELPAVQEAVAKGRPMISGFLSQHEIEPIGGIGLTRDLGT